MNRGQLRAAVRGRAGVPATDGMLDDTTVNGYVQEALRVIETDREWPWLQVRVTFSTVVGTGGYSASTFAPAGDWTKTLSVRLQEDQGPYLESSTVRDLDELYPLDRNDRPQGWAVDVDKLELRPIPDAVYTVVHRYQRTETDMAADADLPLMPARFHSAIVEYAAYLALRRTSELTLAAACRAEYEVWRNRMIDDRRRGEPPPKVRLRQWT